MHTGNTKKLIDAATAISAGSADKARRRERITMAPDNRLAIKAPCPHCGSVDTVRPGDFADEALCRTCHEEFRVRCDGVTMELPATSDQDEPREDSK